MVLCRWEVGWGGGGGVMFYVGVLCRWEVGVLCRWEVRVLCRWEVGGFYVWFYVGGKT